MGIFSKKESCNAQDVRQTMQPLVDLVKEIEMKASGIDQMSKDWITKTEEIIGLIYAFNAQTTVEVHRLLKLLLEGKVSPAVHLAAMKSFSFLTDQTEERMALTTQALIDSGMPYKLGVDFYKNSWKRAFKISPKEMAEFEKSMAGSTKWDWINKTSWR